MLLNQKIYCWRMNRLAKVYNELPFYLVSRFARQHKKLCSEVQKSFKARRILTITSNERN